jgi:sugar O-acyltransferase (sialic acid O-acetyltransferase NeuD family)
VTTVTVPIVIVGAGGFGREVVDVIEAINAEASTTDPSAAAWQLLGVVDDSPTEQNRDRLAARSVRYLGTTDEFLGQQHEAVSYVIGIGSPPVRRRLAERWDAAGHSAATLVHPSATLGAAVGIGPGSVLCAGARVTTNITLGQHVHVNPNVTIGHDTSIGDFTSLNPSSSISGDCVIGGEVLVGVGGIVLNALTVGDGATIGGAACAVRDVGPGTTVVGVPARPLVR